MIRNLKMLGLAIVAVLAFGVVGASGASAESMLTSDGEFTLHGEDEAEGNAFTAFGIAIECANVTYTGESSESGAKVTLSPTYENCLAAGFLPTTINPTGCDFQMTTVSTTTLIRVLRCPPSVFGVDYTIYISHEDHTKNQPFCHIVHQEKEENEEGGFISSDEGGHLTLGGSIEGLSVQKSGACGEEEGSGVSDWAVTLQGVDSKGEPTALELSE